MPLIPPVTNDQATPEQKVIFDHAEQMLGRVAEAVRVGANVPRVMQPLFGFMMSISRKEIVNGADTNVKTLVALKTSLINGCKYCVGHNSIVGKALGYDDAHVAALDGDYAGSGLFNDAEVAAIDWAHHLTSLTYRENPQLMPNLRKHFSDEEIIELTLLSGFYNLWNRFVDGLQVEFEGPEFNKNFGTHSKSLKLEDYLAYMHDCWWNDPEPAAQQKAEA